MSHVFFRSFTYDLYNDHSHTCSGPIDASACHYNYSNDSLEVTLRKKTPGRWKTLEDSRRGQGIVSASSNEKNCGREVLNDLTTPLEAMTMQSDKNRTPTISNDITVTSQAGFTNAGSPSNDNSEEKDLNWQYPSQPKSSDPPRPQSKSPTSPPSSGDHGHQHYCPTHGVYYSHQGTGSGGSSYYGPSTSKFSPDSKMAVDLEVTNPLYRVVQLSRPSLTGLCNLGNSCFMNSVLQCLSNTQLVRDYFVDGRHLADINRNNPLGFKGELAKAFSFLLRKLWSGEYDYFSPKKLRSVIASRSSHFAGNEQHDAHEFMSYLLDGLHEDLNRIRVKPQTPSIESDDRPDGEVAEETWKVHKMRNDSYFVDLFQGLFKSILVCAVCNKVRGRR